MAQRREWDGGDVRCEEGGGRGGRRVEGWLGKAGRARVLYLDSRQ